MHTPGPWRVGRNAEDGYVLAGTVRVCCLCGQPTDADARLIAAAPKLLAACKEARDVVRVAVEYGTHGIDGFDVEEHVTIRTLNAAIAEAGG